MTFTPRHGIHKLVNSLGAAMGVAGFENSFSFPAAQRYVLVLVDGMGMTLLEEHRELAPFLTSLNSIADVSSSIPSTTSVNLTSLGTGLLPGCHGMAGYTCRIPGTMKVLNTLRWDSGINPYEWQPHPTVFEQLAQSGVGVSVLNKDDFEHSGLTQSSQRGVPYISVENSWERLIAVSTAIEQSERALVFGYESSLDFAGHAYGVDSEEWRDALRRIDEDLAELHSSLPSGVTLVITADHGMVDIGLKDRFDVIDFPELLDDVVVFAGEARFRHIHTSAGTEERVATAWRSVLGDKAEVRLRHETENWFGPLDPGVASRFGDVVVASLGDFGVFHSEQHAIEMHMKGFHGSITEAERRIPVLIAN